MARLGKVLSHTYTHYSGTDNSNYIHSNASLLVSSVHSLCSLCLCGVLVRNHQPQRYREHRGCTEKKFTLGHTHAFTSFSRHVRQAMLQVTKRLIKKTCHNARYRQHSQDEEEHRNPAAWSSPE